MDAVRDARRDPIRTPTGEQVTDEELLKALPDGFLAMLSPEHRAAIDHLLARLAAAERVCGLVRVSLSPKLRQTKKKTYWWDVAAAVKEWETLAKP